tara:strand:+ start:1101 stop:1256 length:156 start_codon:yes stop_codon:yes gene_type:complete
MSKEYNIAFMGFGAKSIFENKVRFLPLFEKIFPLISMEYVTPSKLRILNNL